MELKNINFDDLIEQEGILCPFIDCCGTVIEKINPHRRYVCSVCDIEVNNIEEWYSLSDKHAENLFLDALSNLINKIDSKNK